MSLLYRRLVAALFALLGAACKRGAARDTGANDVLAPPSCKAAAVRSAGIDRKHGVFPGARLQRCGVRAGRGILLMLAGVGLVACSFVGSLTFGALPAYAQSCPNSQLSGFTPLLPDCRAYEEVSPPQKGGYADIGASPAGTNPHGSDVADYALATASGSSVLDCNLVFPFLDSGTDDNVAQPCSVASRLATGWSTRGVMPPVNGQAVLTQFGEANILPSADLTQLAFGVVDAVGAVPPYQLSLVGSDGSLTWISKPTISDPLLTNTSSGVVPPRSQPVQPFIAGASADLDAIYFSYGGTLLPSDDQGNPAFGGASRRSVIVAAKTFVDNFGFYEWTPSGGLSYAAVLPDGSVDPYGAQPAAINPQLGTSAPTFYNDNEVSSDGSRAFFVSPDPFAGAPASDPPELYVRETAPDGSQKTVLVSGSAVTGKPAADSPLPMPMPESECGYPLQLEAVGTGCPHPYAYASPDGSRVFFEDVDALTSDAPNDGSVKEYVFDTDTNTLSYLPGVDDQQPGQAGCDGANGICTSPIITSTSDGSRLLFLKETPSGDSLDLLSDGQVTPIAGFPQGPAASATGFAAYFILDGRANTDGSVFVFETSSPIYQTTPGEFNNSGGFEQIYRYTVSSGQLSCLSCAPAGMQNTGDANMSNDASYPYHQPGGSGVTDSRGISSDGDRVFFDSPGPLLPQATSGKRNVYEWEADGDGSCTGVSVGGGCLYLISSGQSTDDSFFLDNSASGNDVFFATTEGLVPQDTDGAYDIYDARVDGGFPQSSEPASCSGDACQGPVTGLASLAGAATVSFVGPKDQTTKGATGKTIRAAARVVDRTVRGESFMVSVRVPTKGRVTLTGADITRTSRSVGNPGSYRLRVRLTRAAVKKLKATRKLKVTVKVAYAPRAGKASRVSMSIELQA